MHNCVDRCNTAARAAQQKEKGGQLLKTKPTTTTRRSGTAKFASIGGVYFCSWEGESRRPVLSLPLAALFLISLIKGLLGGEGAFRIGGGPSSSLRRGNAAREKEAAAQGKKKKGEQMALLFAAMCSEGN